jgi:RNA polymerase sigma-70 factor (ECF subfamily)
MIELTARETAALQQDNYRALAETVEQNRAQLLRLALRFTTSAEDAEDVVQDAILKAFTSLDRFRGDAQIGTWLYAIVLNTGRSWLRSQRAHTLVRLESTPGGEGEVQILDLPCPGPSPEESCRRWEMRRLIFAELARLRPEYQHVIHMCCYKGYSYQEATEALHSNLNSTRSRLARAKRILRERLAMYAPAGATRENQANAGRLSPGA